MKKVLFILFLSMSLNVFSVPVVKQISTGEIIYRESDGSATDNWVKNASFILSIPENDLELVDIPNGEIISNQAAKKARRDERNLIHDEIIELAINSLKAQGKIRADYVLDEFKGRR